MDKNLKHTVTRFFYTLLHLTLMFCAAWLLMFIPYLSVKALFGIKLCEIVNYTFIFLVMFVLYIQIYKKNTLKVSLGRLTFFVFLSIISAFGYNFTIWKLIVYFTDSNEFAPYSNLIYQIFLPIPILFYIFAFKSKKWFKFLEILTISLIIISILSFYIFDL